MAIVVCSSMLGLWLTGCGGGSTVSSCTSQNIDAADCDTCKQYLSMDCFLAEQYATEGWSPSVANRLRDQCLSHDPMVPTDMVVEFFEEQYQDSCCTKFLTEVSDAPPPPDAQSCPIDVVPGRTIQKFRVTLTGDDSQPRASCDDPDARSAHMSDESTMTVAGWGACWPLAIEDVVDQWPEWCDTIPPNTCVQNYWSKPNPYLTPSKPNSSATKVLHNLLRRIIASKTINVSDTLHHFTV